MIFAHYYFVDTLLTPKRTRMLRFSQRDDYFRILVLQFCNFAISSWTSIIHDKKICRLTFERIFNSFFNTARFGCQSTYGSVFVVHSRHLRGQLAPEATYRM